MRICGIWTVMVGSLKWRGSVRSLSRGSISVFNPTSSQGKSASTRKSLERNCSTKNGNCMSFWSLTTPVLVHFQAYSSEIILLLLKNNKKTLVRESNKAILRLLNYNSPFTPLIIIAVLQTEFYIYFLCKYSSKSYILDRIIALLFYCVPALIP